MDREPATLAAVDESTGARPYMWLGEQAESSFDYNSMTNAEFREHVMEQINSLRVEFSDVQLSNDRMASKLDTNTQTTNSTNSTVGEIKDILDTGKSMFRFFGWMARVLKPLGVLAGAGSALYIFWTTVMVPLWVKVKWW